MRHDPVIGVQPGGAVGRTDEGAVLILGAGWMGSRLAVKLHGEGRAVHATNRPGTNVYGKDPYFRAVSIPETVSQSRFDLLAPETWGELPDAAGLSAVVLTFPLSLPMGEQFWESYLKHVRGTVLCYSSTSVYQIDSPGQRVDEATSLRPSPRALAETFLQQRGATVLTLSGIYSDAAGPRGVCSCLSGYLASRAPARPDKMINLVHETDVLDATCACLQTPRPGERFNVAGRGTTLHELLGHCRVAPPPNVVEADAASGADLSSKLVLSDRLLAELMPQGFDFQPIVPPDGEEQAEPALDVAYSEAIRQALEFQGVQPSPLAARVGA